ncbi:hypothetical protein HC891_17045 [Candidatus Gracilibacteria bacterium]|nr:hypothetical protein [Candidatus Gracilibacteria bacterium]
MPMLVAFQIEWNKLHDLLDDPRLADALATADVDALPLTREVGLKLQTIWGERCGARLRAVAQHKKRFGLRMLGGSLIDYERATLRWWLNVEEHLPNIVFRQRPIYFVSSNTHSLINLFSGFALQNRSELVAYLHAQQHSGLINEYEKILAEEVPSSLENFLYYVQKKYQADPASADYFARRAAVEHQLGLHRVPSRFYVDVDTQVFELNKLDPQRLDPRIVMPGVERLGESAALVVNIDYPLGLAAYHILKLVARSVREIRGAYIIGKAATLNGKIGDVLIPNVVYDEHTDNIYNFVPAFSAADIAPYLAHGSVLDNQKAMTSRGTFLQNAAYLDALYRDFFTDVEMEAGPYLNAIYEQTIAERYPTSEHISLLRPPYDLGFLHYASDTPYSKGMNLGARNLSYFGMDPTYATSLAAARRIVAQEIYRMERGV